MALRDDPREAYGRVEFDARVAGASAGELVLLCYERLLAALGTALHAHAAGDNRARSQALTRALTALTALELGIAGSGGVVEALRTFYAAARKIVLDSAPAFSPERIEALRRDVRDIMQAMPG